MITLTESQRKKIEENKAAAILKKQQAIQKLKEASSSRNSNTAGSIVKEKFYEKNFHKSPAKNDSTSMFSIKAVFRVYGENRFIVDMAYHGSSIEVFKTINDRKYENELRKWSFPLSEQSNLVSKLKSACPEVVIDKIPDPVVKVLLEPNSTDSAGVNWNKIDKTLRDYLMPFQVEGVRFGILRNGKCLIADDMGLGKTIQALGIAHYFKENWPLLIVCPSSMKFQWEEAIRTFLPSVQANIQIITTAKDQIIEGDIVITSYDLMKNCYDILIKKKFGTMIFDESHMLKNGKSLRTKAALMLANTTKNIILLSGTPALSRPEELYSQIYAIDPFTFKNFFDFGVRYCDGKKDKFGWNFSGSSNLEELELYLRKKIMIRRLKSEVIKQLSSKIRKVVVLNPNMVKRIKKQIQMLEQDYTNQTGSEKHSTLLTYYAQTGTAKLNAVCEYIEDKLENNIKFLIFAHHAHVIKGICDLLIKKNVDHIKIDGAVSSELRKSYCDKFQNEGSCRVAVLSIKAASCGITLTAAQLVVFAELYWNPGDLTQAEDRAHRIGQQNNVLVEYLVAKGTADDHLWKLLEGKLKTLNKAGLSKDTFKDSDTFHLNNAKQTTLNSFLKSSNSSVEKAVLKSDEELFLTEAEDDIFSNINLEEIEYEYQVNNKKRKTSE